MNLEQLRAKRNEIANSMQALLDASKDAAAMSDEDGATFDALDKEFNGLDAQIRRMEAMAGHATRLDQPRPSVAAATVIEPSTPAPADVVTARGPEARTSFESFGEFLSVMHQTPGDQRLVHGTAESGSQGFQVPAEFMGQLRGEQSMNDGPEGGFAVPTQFDGTLRQVETMPALIRPRATVIPAGSPPDSKITLVALDQGAAQNMYGGVTVQWIGEGETKPETEAKIREIELEPKEVAGHIVVSDKLLRNWQAAGSILSMLLSRAINASEDKEFIQGDGIGKPSGFLGSAAAIAVNRALANDVGYLDLVNMEAEMLPGGTPIWIVSPKLVPRLRLMEDTAGHLIWTDGAPLGSAVGSRPATLLGHPVHMSTRNPGRGVKGDLMLVDLKNYLIKDGSGIFVASSPHVHFTTNKTVIKAFWNVDGQPWLTEPITEEDDATYSPFVVLDVVAA